FVPLYKPTYTLFNTHPRLVVDLPLQPASLCIGTFNTTRLHGQHDFLCFFATCVLNGFDKTRKLNRLIIPNVEQSVGDFPFGRLLLNTNYAYHNIVDIGEVALHFSVVEHLDWLDFENRFRE